MTHKVTPHENGYYLVESGDSGKTYVVTPLGADRADCTCAAGRHGRACKHVAAVLAHAAAPLCPSCGRRMLAEREQYGSGARADRCWPCAQGGK